MAPPPAFAAVFGQLRALLEPYAGRLVVRSDDPENFCLYTGHVPRYGKDLLFGAVQIKKNYVSYHLFPVYMFPDLLDGLPAPLRARMQGKSCFNFKALDEHLLSHLDRLTQRGFDRFTAEQLVG